MLKHRECICNLMLFLKFFLLYQNTFHHLYNRQRGRVVKATDDQQSRFKTYLRHSVVSLGKTLYGTFPCLVVLTSSILNCSHISTKLLADSNILASPEAGRGNCFLCILWLKVSVIRTFFFKKSSVGRFKTCSV